MQLTKIDVTIDYNAMDLQDVKAAFEVVAHHLKRATECAKIKANDFIEEDDIQEEISWFVTRSLKDYIKVYN